MPQVKTLRVAFRYDMLFGITPNQDINFRREFFSFLFVLLGLNKTSFSNLVDQNHCSKRMKPML